MLHWSAVELGARKWVGTRLGAMGRLGVGIGMRVESRARIGMGTAMGSVISIQLRTSAPDSGPPSPTPELHILSLLLLLLSVESLPYLWLQHNLRSDSDL